MRPITDPPSMFQKSLPPGSVLEADHEMSICIVWSDRFFKVRVLGIHPYREGGMYPSLLYLVLGIRQGYTVYPYFFLYV